MMKSIVRIIFVLSFSLILVACSARLEYWIPPSGEAAIRPGLTLFATPIPMAVVPETEVIPLAERPGVLPDISEDTANQPYGQSDQPPILYRAQAADTLQTLAVRFGVRPEDITSPEAIPSSAYLHPGQLLFIPHKLGETTSGVKLIPDSEVVFAPSAADFDIEAFVDEAGGRLSKQTQWLRSTGTLSGAQMVYHVALENSINPRLLLALLEYQSGWVYGNPQDTQLRDYPLGLIDPAQDGLYDQLIWAVNQLSVGYYGYREGRMVDIPFENGTTARLAPDLNAGTAALQYFFARLYQGEAWEAVLDLATGFPALYQRMFSDAWQRAAIVEPLFPSDLAQPNLILPFIRKWVWSYTGGPHGAWEREGAYAALDFSPGGMQAGCVKSSAWVVASASGLVTRSEQGLVAVDLDGDGREQTGWVLIYLHLASEGRVKPGVFVDTGDLLGHPSCEGGISTGTHLHIARKFNGEWIPADGPLPFNLGGWVAHAGERAYLGTLVRGDQVITANTSGNAASFISRAPEDP